MSKPDDLDVRRIFLVFLLIGATSFGGSVVAYLRNRLVLKYRWIDDQTFVELLTIGQSLPGLKAANMAVLIGDRLAGTSGALAALTGVCLPGALLMYVVGLVYQVERDRPLVKAALAGIAPAAVGLILATTLGLGRKALSRVEDLLFIALTVLAINGLRLSVGRALVMVGGVAVLWYGLGGANNTRVNQ